MTVAADQHVLEHQFGLADRVVDQEALANSVGRFRERGIVLRIIAGTAYGLQSPVAVFQPTLYVDIKLDAGAKLKLDDTHEGRPGPPEGPCQGLARGEESIPHRLAERTEVELRLPAGTVYATSAKRSWWSRRFAAKAAADVDGGPS